MHMISVLFTLLSIIGHLLINICMTTPQQYEITFLEEWNNNYHEQILIVISEFQSGWNSAHSQDKLKKTKKKKKENEGRKGKKSSESKKTWQEKVERNIKNSAKMEER